MRYKKEKEKENRQACSLSCSLLCGKQGTEKNHADAEMDAQKGKGRRGANMKVTRFVPIVFIDQAFTWTYARFCTPLLMGINDDNC